MNLTIELPDDLEGALKAKAQAQGVSLAGFARHVLEEPAKPTVARKLKPKKSRYGLLAKYGPGRPRKKSTKTAGGCSADLPRTLRDHLD